MKSQLRILRFLMENKEESFSIRSIAKKLVLNYRIAFDEIKKLENEKLISVKKLGNTNQCSFNYSFNEKILMVEHQKRAELLKNKNLKVLYNTIMGVKNPFFICLVFGSYATGTHTNRSDIDLCIITDNQEVKKKVEQALKTLPLGMHILDFTTKDFISMLKTTELNVGKEIVKNNVILKSVENFYELINYARR